MPSLRTKILTGVFLAWPWWAHAQPPATPSAPAGAVRTISDEAFQRWIKEDTQVVQGILLSLKHIDQLVADIERMVRQLPDFGVAAKPAPPPPPVVVEKTVIQEVEVPGPLGGWMPTLSGAALLALLAFWMGRKLGARRQPTPLPAAAPAPPAAPPAAPAPPAAAKEITPAPPPAPPPMQPAPTPIEPAPSSIEAPLGAESDQSIELAEIMLSMGLGHGAVQTLTEQIRNQPKQALRTGSSCSRSIAGTASRRNSNARPRSCAFTSTSVPRIGIRSRAHRRRSRTSRTSRNGSPSCGAPPTVSSIWKTCSPTTAAARAPAFRSRSPRSCCCSSA